MTSASTTTATAAHPNNFAHLKCPPSTLICREKTIILGDVTIGADCVIHPTTTIIARNGPIVIGSNNLIEERVNIVNNRPEPMRIGDHNVFEVDARCEAIRVGNNNILESKSEVGMNIELTDNCIVGAGCVLSNQNSSTDKNVEIRKLPSHTVISGRDMNMRVVPDLPSSSHGSQLDFLRKILPNYQKLWRPNQPNLPTTPQQQK